MQLHRGILKPDNELLTRGKVVFCRGNKALWQWGRWARRSTAFLRWTSALIICPFIGKKCVLLVPVS